MSIFGSEFEKIWPKAGDALNFTDFGKNLLRKCRDIKKPDIKQQQVDIEAFKTKSSNFPLEFGTNTCRVMSQPKDRYPYIQKQIASAYPLIHERVLKLYLDFLEHKCQYGNNIEKEIYNNITINEFIQRLLMQRCVSFFGKNDKYLLITRQHGCGGFMDVGTLQEKPPLLLKNVLSYDEMKLSAFLTVSSHSEFINNGNRQNCGVIATDKRLIEQEGVIVGLIGARLVKRNVMEYQDIIINKTQNIKANGYGKGLNEKSFNKAEDYRKMWQQFYDENDFLYANVKKNGKRFGDCRNQDDIFDNIIMKKRYTISFDLLLLESEKRAADENKLAYVHVVGIGLGVWKMAEQQEKIFLETFSQRIKYLLPKLNHIGVIHFSWFQLNEWHDLKNNGKFQSETHPLGGITIHISKRNPHVKLSLPEHDNMLLIVSYAWDGNALPGNEFWMKMLKSTSDSATACSTLITELHNPHINCQWVNGNNLHVASERYGSSIEKQLYENLSLRDFIERLLKKRCAAFVGPTDTYLLLNGLRGEGNNYQNVGTEQEKAPLTLTNVLSYDEIKLSAFLSVSSYTEFINDGNRYNRGIIEEDLNKIQLDGVVIGLIGARFERPELMEYQDIVIDEQQNILAKGYGEVDDTNNVDNYTKDNSPTAKQLVYYHQLWSNFYNENNLLYEKVIKEKDNLRYRYISQASRKMFDNVMMKKRYAISFDTLLLEAQARASQANCQAYIHIVGIGLGVWRIVQHQTQIFLECFLQRVHYLLSKLTNVGVLHFSWFHMTEWHNLRDNGFISSDNHPNGGIKTFLSNRNPNEKLPSQYEKMLLIVSYAWDGNALPGNEFWLNSLDGSNDPSTACSTLISELHNPHINDQTVCANNLHIASLDFGVLHISEYVQKIQSNL